MGFTSTRRVLVFKDLTRVDLIKNDIKRNNYLIDNNEAVQQAIRKNPWIKF